MTREARAYALVTPNPNALSLQRNLDLVDGCLTTRDVTIPIFLEPVPERFHGPKEPLMEPIPGWNRLQLWNQLQCHNEIHNMDHF